MHDESIVLEDTISEQEVQLLSKLGGWVPHKNRKPGKIILTCGLARVLDMLATQAALRAYVAEHGHLPPMEHPALIWNMCARRLRGFA